MPVTIHPEHPCPICKTPLNALGTGDPAADPQPGDYTICVSCHAILILNQVRVPRRLTDAEWTDLVHDQATLASVLDTLAKIKACPRTSPSGACPRRVHAGDGSWRQEVGLA
jgi:hypothetical protein